MERGCYTGWKPGWYSEALLVKVEYLSKKLIRFTEFMIFVQYWVRHVSCSFHVSLAVMQLSLLANKNYCKLDM